MRTKKAKIEDKKAQFIRLLAVYFTSAQAERSIKLEMGNADAMDWAMLRSATPLFGYPTADEAELILKEFLG